MHKIKRCLCQSIIGGQGRMKPHKQIHKALFPASYPPYQKVKPERKICPPRCPFCVLFLWAFPPLAVIKGSVCPDNYPRREGPKPSSLLPWFFDKFGSCSQNYRRCTSSACGCLRRVCTHLCVCMIKGFVCELLLSPCDQLCARIDLVPL